MCFSWKYNTILVCHLTCRRAVLVKEPDKLGEGPLDILSAEFAVQTSVQEYGGGAFSVSGNMVVFSNDKDQRLYKLIIGGKVSW